MKVDKSREKKITKKTKLSEIAENEKLAKILIEEYGLFCVSCHLAPFETLEEGAKAHGMEEKEIGEMVEKLRNAKLKSQNSRLRQGFGGQAKPQLKSQNF